MTLVLKIGGNQLDDPAFIGGMAAAVRALPAPPVIVHGGGQSIKALQERLGIVPRYVGGLRVTDPETLTIVMMSLIGAINPMLVAALHMAGIQAQGLNGADQGLLRGEKLSHPDGDLGAVGVITAVRGEVLRGLLAAGIVPVIAPIMLDAQGAFFNINADRAAGAVAAALEAERVVFLTNVPGVLKDGALVAALNRTAIQTQIEAGVITGGMAVKVNAALDALSAGVRAAVITDLAGLGAGTGTTIRND